MAAKRGHTLRIGDSAPEFRLPVLDGGEVTLGDLLAGGPALLAFFKISCPVCQLTFPFLERIHAAGTLRIYAVSQNDAAATREFNRAYGVTFPTLLDPEATFPASNAYGITTVPTLFLVEPGGSISWMLAGWSQSDIRNLGARAGVNPFREREAVPEWKAG